MIILGILLIHCILLVRLANERRTAATIASITFIWCFSWLCILHFELLQNGLNTYGSDETVYYNSMLTGYSSENWFSLIRKDFNFSYILYGTLILKTSFIQSVFLIRLCNVFLLINTFLLMYRIFTYVLEIKSKKMNIIIMTMFLNGIVTWTAIRNLKDTLFIYMLMILLYYILNFLKMKKISLLGLISIAISYFVLQDIRQWFFYLILIIGFIVLFFNLIEKKRYVILSIYSIGAISILLYSLRKGFSTLLLYTVTYSDFQTNVLGGDAITGLVRGGVLSLPISMGRFILGPGPIRALFGSDSFVNYTVTGNILIFIGGFLWWIFLPLFIISLTSIKHARKNYILLTVILAYWGLYSYAYSGSGDTRLRAVLYILALLYTIPFLEEYWNKKYAYLYIILLFIVAVTGSYFSFISLS